MIKNISQALLKLEEQEALSCLAQGLHGIERETLRTTKTGQLALTPHPKHLSDPLTDPFITTDFSESQLELITPPMDSVSAAIGHLRKTHKKVLKHLPSESLWPFSTPCGLPENEAIPLAKYGNGPAAQTKEIYRKGLELRTGKPLQMFCGVHYNMSFSDALWTAMHAARGSEMPLQDYKNEALLSVVRGHAKWAWLLTYLTGASPYKDASYVCQKADAEPQNLFTSFRLGRCGYKNRVPLHVDHKTYGGHLASLETLTKTPHAPYTALGIWNENGEQQQLNDSILQIANEYYSPLRMKPKPHPDGFLQGLQATGAHYLELRLLDVNPFSSTGVDPMTLHFSHLFLVWCLLANTPAYDEKTHDGYMHQMEHVADAGAQGLSAEQQAQAQSLLQEMKPLLVHFPPEYATAFNFFSAAITDPSPLPWHKIHVAMKTEKDFLSYGMDLAHQHAITLNTDA